MIARALWINVLAVGVCAAGVYGQARGILDVGSERANRAVITMGEELPELTPEESDMTRLLRGVLADLRGKGLDELRACVPANPMLGDASSDERVCVIHLIGGRGQKKVAVVQGAGGDFIAVEIGVEGKPRRAELRREQFTALLGSWPLYRGGFHAADVKEPSHEVFELEKPYVPGRITMDQKTLGDRFLNGGKTNLQGADRNLADEKIWARLPKGYDPKSPAGLVVWVDPTASGKPPAPFNAALDAFGLICVGAAEAATTGRLPIESSSRLTGSRRSAGGFMWMPGACTSREFPVAVASAR
jgi:hypothetical protein